MLDWQSWQETGDNWNIIRINGDYFKSNHPEESQTNAVSCLWDHKTKYALGYDLTQTWLIKIQLYCPLALEVMKNSQTEILPYFVLPNE